MKPPKTAPERTSEPVPCEPESNPKGSGKAQDVTAQVKIGTFQLQTSSFWLGVIGFLCLFILGMMYMTFRFQQMQMQMVREIVIEMNQRSGK